MRVGWDGENQCPTMSHFVPFGEKLLTPTPGGGGGERYGEGIWLSKSFGDARAWNQWHRRT